MPAQTPLRERARERARAGLKNNNLRRLASALGRRLRRLRAEHGLTQRAAAERVGVAPPVLRRLESGTANPTLAVLVSAARAFDISLATLLRRKD